MQEEHSKQIEDAKYEIVEELRKNKEEIPPPELHIDFAEGDDMLEVTEQNDEFLAGTLHITPPKKLSVNQLSKTQCAMGKDLVKQ